MASCTYIRLRSATCDVMRCIAKLSHDEDDHVTETDEAYVRASNCSANIVRIFCTILENFAHNIAPILSGLRYDNIFH